MNAHVELKQRFVDLGITVSDLDHAAGMLLARMYPKVAEAAYLTAVVLLLRQGGGAIAIPWPGSGVGSGRTKSASDGEAPIAASHEAPAPSHPSPPLAATVVDLLAENLPAMKAGVTPAMVRTAFAHMAAVSLQHLMDVGVIVPVSGDDAVMDSAVVLLDRNRLYLRRFWRYEVEVARMVLSRSVPVEPGSRTTPPDHEVGTSARTTAVEDEMGTAGGNAPDLDGSASDEIIVQDQAVQAGLAYRFAVITGGPGTGKTYSVLLLLTAMLQRDPSLRIVLCAPTGKAAARMMESIHGSLERLNPPEQVRAGIPESASTIHRLIRWNPSLGKSVYDAQNPLPYDVVILDEASMVDVALMSRLARALRADTRLILLGDKDQLSSVEAGSVFADIAARDVPNVVRLTRSWRFSADSEIGRLARVINAGDGEGSWAMLQAGDQVGVMSAASVSHQESLTVYHRDELYGQLAQRIMPHHAALSAEADDYRALRQLSEFQILAALRVGPYGADQLNAELDRRIGGGAVWYVGRPVIATANNYDLDVFNGDVGLTRMIDGRLMVAFEGSAPGSVRWIAPAQLKSVSSAWALTVHKSQGSEYDDVVLILPDRHAPVLSRELAYTALTRARHRFQVWGSGSVWRQMLAGRVERYSGLADRLAHHSETT